MAGTRLDYLVKHLNPKARMPRRFDLWSRKMQIAWLKQNQKKEE